MSSTLHTELRRLVRGFSIETTPSISRKTKDFRELLEPGTTVYVTLLPNSEMKDTLATCKRLAQEGMVPVPHFSARQIENRHVLESSLKQLVDESGTTQVLTIAGGGKQPIGDFDNSMQLLETGLFDEVGIRKIGIAGHPEGTPDIPPEDVEAALLWKKQFSERSDADFYLATQFCFDANPVIEWTDYLTKLGIAFPVHLGVTGLAKITKLILFATACGIGNSIQVLRRKKGNLKQLAQNVGPDEILLGLAKYRVENPGYSLDDIHIYPLGDLKESAAWFRAIEDGRFAIDELSGTIVTHA